MILLVSHIDDDDDDHVVGADVDKDEDVDKDDHIDEDEDVDDVLHSLVICVVKDSWVGVSSRAMALEIIRKYHGRSETMARGIRKL